MALQSSASVGDPICLSEVKTEFDLISSDCLTGFYKPHSESSVPASGTICLSDFLGESQVKKFEIDNGGTYTDTTHTTVFMTNFSSGGEAPMYIPLNMLDVSMKGHISTFLYTHNSPTTHTLSVKHQHGGTGTSRTGQPYSTLIAADDWAGSNNGYFTDSARWSSYLTDYDYITKVVYTFSSVYDGDDFTVTSEKPSTGWGTSATNGMWVWESGAGLDGGGQSVHTFLTPSFANQHLGAGAGAGDCGDAYRTVGHDRIYFSYEITYIPH